VSVLSDVYQVKKNSCIQNLQESVLVTQLFKLTQESDSKSLN